MDKAMEDFKQAALLEPDNVEIWLAKTRFDCSTGQMEEAVVDAKRTVDVANGDAEVCKEMLPILINAPDEQIRTEAKAVLDKLVAIYSDDLELQLCMVEYLVAERTNTSIDEAEEILQRVLSIENAPARARVLLAEIFMIRGDNSRAMEIVLSGLERDEKNKSLLQLKAGIEAKTSAKLAIPTRELLCELYPNDVFTAISLAECYLQTDQLLKAVDLLEKQREIFKAGRGRRQIDIKMATAFYRQGKTGLASELFASLCDGTDADIEIIMARVKLLIREQNWSGVRRITTGQMQKGERHISLVADIAQELVETGNRQAKLTAKSLLEQILEVYPDSVDAMRALAEQSYISSRFSEAVRLYGRILEMAPNDMKAINNLCWIMCEQDKQYSSALELANRGLASNSDCAELLDTRGMIYYQLGEYTKAAEDFDKSLNLCKAGSRAALFSHVHLGKVLVRLGRTQAAVENFNHALQLHDYVGGLSGNDIMEIRNLLQDISGGV
jgi:tetratricopeptide (TPR) repeat protein